MKDINSLIVASAAPFNRDERFFTGTILPLLVSGNDFNDLKPLINLMAPSLNLSPEYSDTHKNVLFYTEYNLKKSGYVKSTTSVPDNSETKIDGDTPDVLFYVWDNDKMYLFAIEVKMYHRPTTDKLALQMQRQYVVLKDLAAKANIPDEHIFHCALLPEKTLLGTNKHKVITWEQIYKLYSAMAVNKYAIDVLGYAISNYDNLVSKQSTGKKNNTGKYTGLRIVAEHLLLNIKYVGCGGGLNGLNEHVEKETWHNFPFEVIQEDKNVSEKIMPKKNWFTINDFLFITGNKAAGAAN